MPQGEDQLLQRPKPLLDLLHPRREEFSGALGGAVLQQWQSGGGDCQRCRARGPRLDRHGQRPAADGGSGPGGKGALPGHPGLGAAQAECPRDRAAAGAELGLPRAVGIQLRRGRLHQVQLGGLGVRVPKLHGGRCQVPVQGARAGLAEQAAAPHRGRGGGASLHLKELSRDRRGLALLHVLQQRLRRRTPLGDSEGPRSARLHRQVALGLGAPWHLCGQQFYARGAL
mmetsp:Transcript_115360/g.337275  ORF Transcript_115360/g.337275 Transcript_115360/m.337275 type:complete len:228 (+) Transcript_115360:352-1035(+)